MQVGRSVGEGQLKAKTWNLPQQGQGLGQGRGSTPSLSYMIKLYPTIPYYKNSLLLCYKDGLYKGIYAYYFPGAKRSLRFRHSSRTYFFFFTKDNYNRNNFAISHNYL